MVEVIVVVIAVETLWVLETVAIRPVVVFSSAAPVPPRVLSSVAGAVVVVIVAVVLVAVEGVEVGVVE